MTNFKPFDFMFSDLNFMYEFIQEIYIIRTGISYFLMNMYLSNYYVYSLFDLKCLIIGS